jgi:hydroxymethylglutaryl-CoA lyase
MMFITECPRDAMQGIHEFIPSKTKIDYIKSLIEVGFPVIDTGSFVSPKSIPQMADSAEVFKSLGEVPSTTKLLAIVANQRGALEAAGHENISILGYPFSVSETFQKRNTNAGIEDSLVRVEEIAEIAAKSRKVVLVYLSMAFGNAYGDPWSPELLTKWAEKLANMGIKHLALADTIGISNESNIKSLFQEIIPSLPELTISAHLHAKPDEVWAKTQAAWEAGCRHFDSALKGFGGCPMAGDTLTGNLATETLVQWCETNHVETNLNTSAFNNALLKSSEIFNRYH